MLQVSWGKKTAINNVLKRGPRKTYSKSGWSWWTRFSRRTLNNMEQKEDKFDNELQYHWVVFFSLAAEFGEGITVNSEVNE